MTKPRIWFYHDGRHPHIYRYEPPMSREQWMACIDELAGTPVEAVSFCLGEGRTMLHDTGAGELLGHNVDRWDHLVFRRAHQNAKALIDAGDDPLRLVCEQAHRRGIRLYPCLLVQNPGVESATVRCSDFRKDNPHLEIRARKDVDDQLLWIDGLDFAHDEVRRERSAVIDEALTEYDVDGFELQLNIQPRFFHPDDVDTSIMTDWVGSVHERVHSSGDDRELAIRVPLELETAYDVGLDVAEWLRRGLVDVLIPELLCGPQRVDPNLDFQPWLRRAEGTSCRVIPALHSGVRSDRLGEAPISMIRAQACNYWEQGVDGLYLAQWFQRWPYEAEFYECLRELPFADIMAPKDKYYYVPTEDSFGSPGGAPTRLPAELIAQTPTHVRFVISDDLPHWHEAGRVHEVLLRVGLTENTELDRVSFRLNGHDLPATACRRINQLYRMQGPRHRAGPSYWHVFRLDESCWPRRGDNDFEVTLRERDAAALGPVSLRDVELEIRYLMGRSFHRGFVDPDLGPSTLGVS
jgi:hypothetical protein